MPYIFSAINAKNTNFGKERQVNSIKYIVIHYTGNNGDTAKGNGNYFAYNNTGASAHYFADENNVVQSVRDNYVAWHCGGKKYYHNNCRNENSIGIELCSEKDSKGEFYFNEGTVNNALELTKKLMTKYNVPAENVIRHYDVTHKICPAPFVNNGRAWQNFKKRLEVNAMIDNYDDAVKVLADNGVITTAAYWNNAVKVVKYLDALIINMANKLE